MDPASPLHGPRGIRIQPTDTHQLGHITINGRRYVVEAVFNGKKPPNFNPSTFEKMESLDVVKMIVMTNIRDQSPIKHMFFSHERLDSAQVGSSSEQRIDLRGQWLSKASTNASPTYRDIAVRTQEAFHSLKFLLIRSTHHELNLRFWPEDSVHHDPQSVGLSMRVDIAPIPALQRAENPMFHKGSPYTKSLTDALDIEGAQFFTGGLSETRQTYRFDAFLQTQGKDPKEVDRLNNLFRLYAEDTLDRSLDNLNTLTEQEMTHVIRHLLTDSESIEADIKGRREMQEEESAASSPMSVGSSSVAELEPLYSHMEVDSSPSSSDNDDLFGDNTRPLEFPRSRHRGRRRRHSSRRSLRRNRSSSLSDESPSTPGPGRRSASPERPIPRSRPSGGDEW